MKGANMKNRIVTCLLVLSVSLLFTGCGPTMIDLTEEQENDVALYSAKVVSKFNINQDKGIMSLPKEDKTDSTVPAVPGDSTEKKETGDDSSTEPAAQPGDSEDDTEDSTEVVVSKTLTEALDVKNISFLYRDAKVSSSYGSGDVYDLTPDKGNELVVMRFKAVNNSSTDVKVNLFKMNLHFSASYGSKSANSDATLLLNDLTTYEGTIKAGKSKNMVVLFQFPKGTVKDTSKIVLQETMNSTTYQIDLAGSKNK